MQGNLGVETGFRESMSLDSWETQIRILKSHYGAGAFFRIGSAIDPEIEGIAPYPKTVPSLSGDAEVGQTLSVTPGTYYSDTVITYEWYRDGELIEGESTDEYVLVEDDEETLITVVEVATNRYGSTRTELGPVGPVEPEEV